MGWRGTMRSVGSAIRAAERDAQRRHKAAMAAQLVSEAESAVAGWENYIDELITIHTNRADSMNWTEIAERPKPKPPERSRAHRRKAQDALESFKPGLSNKLFGGTEKKKQRLQLSLEQAIKDDETADEKNWSSYQTELADWETDTQLARRLLDGENEAIRQVIEEFQTMTVDNRIGSAVSFTIKNGCVHAKARVHSDEIIPDYRRKQLASGRLSESKMPVAQFNELYQDYVASVALKIGGDLLGILPQDEFFITCEAEMLNTQTGYKEPTPILSVKIVRPTFESLNLAALDPSDSMANFTHEMDFKKSKGFSPVSALADW